MNINDNGQIWKPLNQTINKFSLTGTTDKKVEVNCTNLNESYLTTVYPIVGGVNYLLKFRVDQVPTDKRLFLQIRSKTGSNSWAFTDYRGCSIRDQVITWLTLQWRPGWILLVWNFYALMEVQLPMDRMCLIVLIISVSVAWILLPVKLLPYVTVPMQQDKVCIVMDLMARRMIMRRRVLVIVLILGLGYMIRGWEDG